MKFYSNQVKEIAKSMLEGKITTVLFYGPNHGLIKHSLNSIIDILKVQKQNVSYSDTEDSSINSLLNNLNLFGDKELIILSDIGTSIKAPLKEIVLSNNSNFLIILADELAPSSSLRKFFEQENLLASVACYNDDPQSVEKLVRNYCADLKKHISADAMQYLKHYLYGDRYIVLSELDKLFTYTINSTEITLDDVQNVISASITPEPDMLCIYFFKKDWKNYLIELDKILSENISAIWVIRALIRYTINIYFTLERTSDGMSLADSISAITPPIFFKYTNDFKQISSQVNKSDILAILSKLYKIEKDIKSGSQNDKQLLTSLICQMFGDGI
ncbi:MAG: polymerase subunit delta [Pseudomonadota bacterium]|jgi:DNA polymerase-3 subunit delta